MGYLTGSFKNNESLDISTFYEFSIFTNDIMSQTLQLLISNDSVEWFKYRKVDTCYIYLEDLMANYIKIETEDDMTFQFNANLK